MTALHGPINTSGAGPSVALLTEAIDYGMAGFRTYVTGLVDGLLALDGPERYTLLHRLPHAYYADKRSAFMPAPERMPSGLHEHAWRQARLPRYLRAEGYDLVHETYHFGPFLAPSRFARVVTIGDLTPLVGNYHPIGQRLLHLTLVPLLARRAHRVLTFSENSKRDIVRLYRIPSEKVVVTPLSADGRFRPLPRAEVEAARRRLGLPERYVLHVGTIEPRKNVGRLIQAFAAALPALGDCRLLLVGRRGWMIDGLDAQVRASGAAGRIVMRQDIADADLPPVYNAAELLAYPSLYEGFGLPPLEAMRCGVPVVTSATSSLPEVVGDAAVSVDPADVAALAAAIGDVYGSAALRGRLVTAGLRRAGLFSWRRCAEITREAYREALVVAGPAGAEANAAARVA